MYPEGWARFAAILMFFGFNFTFFPQFILGYLGMPRRYHVYPPEFQVYNVHVVGRRRRCWRPPTCCRSVYLGLVADLGQAGAGDNPWGATGLEWQTTSPPPRENFAPSRPGRRGPLRLPPGGHGAGARAARAARAPQGDHA